MKTKLLALFLAAAMLIAASATCVSAAAASADASFGDYSADLTEDPEIFIGGIPVTQKNCYDILFDVKEQSPKDRYQGYASYDPKTNTLTLKDAYIGTYAVDPKKYEELAKMAATIFGKFYKDFSDIGLAFRKAMVQMFKEFGGKVGFCPIFSLLGENETLTIKLYGNNTIASDNFALLCSGNIRFDFAEGASLYAEGNVWSFKMGTALEMYDLLMGLDSPVLSSLMTTLTSALKPIDRLMSGTLLGGVNAFGMDYLVMLYEYFMIKMIMGDRTVFGDITVNGGPLNVLSCPDVNPLLLSFYQCICDMSSKFTAGSEDNGAFGAGYPEEMPSLLKEFYMSMSQLFPVSVITANNFTAVNAKVDIDVYDVTNCKDDYFAQHSGPLSQILPWFFGAFVNKAMYPPINDVHIDNKLVLDNSLFYVSRRGDIAPGVESVGNALYVRNGIECEEGYSLQGSPFYVEYSARNFAEHTLVNPVHTNDAPMMNFFFFTDLIMENGFFRCNVVIPELLGKALQALKAALPFLGGSVTNQFYANTVWVQSASFCSGIKEVGEPENSGIYYLDPGEPLEPFRDLYTNIAEDPVFFGNMPLYFEKVYDGSEWFIHAGFRYFRDKSASTIGDSISFFDKILAVRYNEGEKKLEVFPEEFNYHMIPKRPVGPYANTWKYKDGMLSADLYDIEGNYFCTAYLYCEAGFAVGDKVNSLLGLTSGVTLKVTTTPRRAGLYTESQNVEGHDYRVVDPEEFGMLRRGFHALECASCGDFKVEPCSYDPKTGECVCGSVDPMFTKVEPEDVKVSTQKNKIPGTNLFIVSVTIRVEHDPRYPVFVEYMAPGTNNWMPYVIPFSLAPNQYLTELLIRVTDINHNQYDFMWEDGYGVYPFEPLS